MYRDCRMNVDPKSKKVVLELLSSCNLNCQHCIYKIFNNFPSPSFLPKDKAFRLINKFVKNQINKLVLTGGEPTLHPSFIEIARYAISKIPKISLCTNGVILNKGLENKVIEFNFSNYTVSIDSHLDRVHDAFRGMSGALKKTVNFLKKLKSKKKSISLHITLCPLNISHLKTTIKFCQKFTSEVVIGSIYHNTLKMNPKEMLIYNQKIARIRNKYINHPAISLVGFTPFCENKNCLDQKNIFMINCEGKLVECYWKKRS